MNYILEYAGNIAIFIVGIALIYIVYSLVKKPQVIWESIIDENANFEGYNLFIDGVHSGSVFITDANTAVGYANGKRLGHCQSPARAQLLVMNELGIEL